VKLLTAETAYVNSSLQIQVMTYSLSQEYIHLVDVRYLKNQKLLFNQESRV